MSIFCLPAGCIVRAEDEREEGVGTVKQDIGGARDGSKTDDEVVQREEEAIKLDGLNVAQVSYTNTILLPDNVRNNVFIFINYFFFHYFYIAIQKSKQRFVHSIVLILQMKELREKAEKHEFQAEVNRMMKLIINSLYRNKEVSW